MLNPPFYHLSRPQRYIVFFFYVKGILLINCSMISNYISNFNLVLNLGMQSIVFSFEMSKLLLVKGNLYNI